MTILEYIEDYLTNTTVTMPKSTGNHIGLPNSYVSPCVGIYKDDQYYWDSYFMILGLLQLGKVDLAKGMVDNMAFLFRQFSIMPMRNRWSDLGLSQPPLYTSMIEEIYAAMPDKRWLKDVVEVAEWELNGYWLDKTRAEKHLVYKGLSRYADHYLLNDTAEHESGWDMTSRFNNHCLDFLPVDLNAFLYKYEVDLARFYGELGELKKRANYLKRSLARQRTMSELMWNDAVGFFIDYDYRHKRPSSFMSLAGFVPLWAKMATPEQAKKVRDNLVVFEQTWGLATSQKVGRLLPFKQWDYPNGWPNMHWIVVTGLLNYGFTEDAMRIANKWLSVCNKVFEETGQLWEKYNVAKGSPGKSGLYKTQSGFGWTNMMYLKLSALVKNATP